MLLLLLLLVSCLLSTTPLTSSLHSSFHMLDTPFPHSLLRLHHFDILPAINSSRISLFHLLFLTLVSSAAAAAAAVAAASSPVDLSLLSAEEREKRAKAIRKKLKAVEEVKEKQSAGQKLDAGQVSKTLLLCPDCFYPFHLFFLTHLLSALYPLLFPFITLLTRFQLTFLILI